MIKSVAIGTFDGIHIAHQELIKRADAIVVIERYSSSITPGYNKAIFAKKPTFYYLFDKIKNDTPKSFIDRLKLDFKDLEKIVVGYDFKFGKDKKGTIDTLKSIFKGIEVVEEVKKSGISVHSKIIRELIVNSKIKEANILLGRSYQIKGYQIKGQGLGAKKLVPTINLDVKQYSLPRGVFAVKVDIENRLYKAICFVGNRETIDNKFSIEINILEDYNLDYIDSQIKIEFIDFIRENRKFNNLKELKKQITLDIVEAKNILNN